MRVHQRSCDDVDWWVWLLLIVWTFDVSEVVYPCSPKSLRKVLEWSEMREVRRWGQLSGEELIVFGIVAVTVTGSEVAKQTVKPIEPEYSVV